MNTFMKAIVCFFSGNIWMWLWMWSGMTHSFVLQSPPAVPSLSLLVPSIQRPGLMVLHSMPPSQSSRSTTSTGSSSKDTFQLVIDVPPSNSDVQVSMNIESILSVPSELIVVRYKVPFGLNIEPRKNFAIVTANGPGGEQVGDVLRYTSHWTMGLPRGDGIGTTFASFAGGLKWQCSMFNVMSVKQWEQVIQALVSNTADRTDEVVLIFERPLNGVVPPELQ
jgi:hypothetical protein